MGFFLLFWLSSIRTSVSFFGKFSEAVVCLWSKQQVLGRAGEILQPCTSWDLQRSQSTRIKAPPKPASQPSSHHPQPKPLLKLESDCELQTRALQSTPGQQEASSCWTGCHSPPLLAAGHTQGQHACPAPQGCLAA